jgi:bifunctional NMN adenylyltransferase/nudix hydrolase
MKPYDIGLLVGRFQHFHLGHKHLIDTGLTLCDRMLVLIGSSQEWGTLRNPFSVITRNTLIKEIYGDSIIIKDLPDMTHENDINPDWGRYVLKHVKESINKLPEIMIYGNDEQRSRWFDMNDIKNIMEVIVPRSTIPISATQMREYLILNETDKWHQYSPAKIHKYYGKLRDELLATEHYKEIHRKIIRGVTPIDNKWEDRKVGYNLCQ